MGNFPPIIRRCLWSPLSLRYARTSRQWRLEKSTDGADFRRFVYAFCAHLRNGSLGIAVIHPRFWRQLHCRSPCRRGAGGIVLSVRLSAHAEGLSKGSRRRLLGRACRDPPGRVVGSSLSRPCRSVRERTAGRQKSGKIGRVTTPALLIAFLIASSYGAFYHLLRGGGVRRLFLYLLLAWLGFAVGQSLSLWRGWRVFPLGPIELGLGTLGSLLLLLVGDWLSRIRAR